MKREDLKELNLSDDALDKIMALHGADIEKHKNAVTTAKAEADTLKKQLDDAGKQIESFKGMDVEGIKKAADDWKAKYEQAQKDAAAQLESVKFEHSLEGALSAAKAKNIKAVRALLNLEGLKLSDDGILGLKEQLEKIKAENDYLFEGEKPVQKIVDKTTNTTTSDGLLDTVRKYAGVATKETK